MDTVKSLTEALLGAFEAQTFLRKLAMSGADAAALVIPQEWEGPLNVLLPFEQRLTCDQVLEMALPLLNRLTPPPKEGWMVYAYHVAVSLLYDEADVEHTAKQRDAALCYLNILQVLFDAEREALPSIRSSTLPFVRKRNWPTAALPRNTGSFWCAFGGNTFTRPCALAVK